MKQFDSYLIYGCHFPSRCINMITEHSNLKFFNTKISSQYNCDIVKLNVPHADDIINQKYFLRILVEQSDEGLMKLENVVDIDKKGYHELVNMFELDKIEPYLISVPIVREL